MEKEQKKLSTGVVILIITLIVGLITVSTMYALELLKEDDVSRQQITEENAELEDVEESEDENKEEKEETTKVEEVEEEVKDEEAEYGTKKVKETKAIELNNKKYDIEVNIKEGKIFLKQEDYYDCELEYSIKLNNGKELNVTAAGNLNNHGSEPVYEIGKIKDKYYGDEYITLKIANGRLYNGKTVYVINEKTEILGVLSTEEGTTFFEWDKEKEEIIRNYELEINEDNIVNYLWAEEGSDMVKHKYTIEEGIFVDRVEKVYKNGEFSGAGKKK